MLTVFLYLCMQLPRSIAVTMEMFVLLTGQMREREGWKCVLEVCGELCVIIIIGAIVLLVWCADSWDLKWTKEQVHLVILNLHKCYKKCYRYY